MSLDEYKLSCELFGHTQDVRAVCEGQIGQLLTGSRDNSVKIWTADGGSFYESLTLKNHTDFVLAICLLDDGNLICTASQDKTVCVYAQGNTVPLTVLRGHTKTVCSLAPGLEPNTVVSGSWDHTARVWTIGGFGPSDSMVLTGHEGSVLDITTLPSVKQFVTASADHTICFWNLCGEKLKVLKGHTDCVRGIRALPDGGLVSCGNDAIVKFWSADGECVRELYGHGHYIYSIALNPKLGPDVCVTGGEDSTIRLWSKSAGPLGEPIVLPAESVWSVACLRNGDIVAATSDGVIRVFTRDEGRFASDAIRKSFSDTVTKRTIEANLQQGGYKIEELGPESLQVPGTKPGERKIVRETDGRYLCYIWQEGEWQLLGDVTGAMPEKSAGPPGQPKKSKKAMHEGKEYDFVFHVDISDTGAPLPLPYNCSEEPWLVAQKFIHLHELPQAYLEQVANFIIKNSANATPTTTPNPSSDYVDPFTGGGRYIPGSSSSSSQFGNAGDMIDPFTGASSYRTAAAATSSNGHQQPNINVQFKNPTSSSSAPIKYFPFSTNTTFVISDPTKVLAKIKEFNQNVAADLKVEESALDNVIKLMKPNLADYKIVEKDLDKLLRWPKEIFFPVLDVIRFAVCDPSICKLLTTNKSFVQLIIENIGHGAGNALMSIRCFANMMTHEYGQDIVKKYLPDIVKKLNRIMSGSNNLQVNIATLYLNVTVSQLEYADQEICRQVTEAILEFLRWTHDAESFYRSYQALGNLTCTPHGITTSAQIISVDEVVNRLRDHMSADQAPGMEKLNGIARELTAAL